jgi:hypothetical protein
MTTNLGLVDRSTRLVIAAVLIVVTLINVLKGTVAAVALIVAVIFIFTSFIGNCPLYTLFRINMIFEARIPLLICLSEHNSRMIKQDEITTPIGMLDEIQGDGMS